MKVYFCCFSSPVGLVQAAAAAAAEYGHDNPSSPGSRSTGRPGAWLVGLAVSASIGSVGNVFLISAILTKNELRVRGGLAQLKLYTVALLSCCSF